MEGSIATVEVKGLSELLANLQTMERAIAFKLLRRGLRAAGKVYAQEVKSKAYGAGRQRQSGALGAGYRVTIVTSGDKMMARLRTAKANVIPQVKGPRLRSAMPKPRARTPFWWRFLEFGVPQERRTKKGASRGVLSARPWVEPAFESKANEAIEAFRQVLERGIAREAAQLPAGRKPT
jgi:HK97 gp10 family phage protein